MDHILLPSTIEVTDGDRPHVGQVVITPCQQGYGTTLGNALRRVLLSSLPGAAVESMKIHGVQHEFDGIDGVQEDVIEIILNLKQVAVHLHADESVVLSLKKKGPGAFTAGDFEKNSDVEIVNPELVIMNVTTDREIEMEITIGKGSGYVMVSEKETGHLDLGTIAIDSLYSPIRDVGYKVEMTRVGDITDYEKLTVTVETDGTITVKEAFAQTTKILMDHLSLIIDAVSSQDAPKTVSEKNPEPLESTVDNE